MSYLKQAGVRFIQVLQVMCGDSVNFKEEDKKLNKTLHRQRPAFKSSWVREGRTSGAADTADEPAGASISPSTKSATTSATITSSSSSSSLSSSPSGGRRRDRRSSQRTAYGDQDSVSQLFAATVFGATSDVALRQSSAPVQASSETLGKWSLWMQLQNCTIVECAAITILSNLYNSDVSHINTTPYSFVTVGPLSRVGSGVVSQG